jgi:hypothetical protein
MKRTSDYRDDIVSIADQLAAMDDRDYYTLPEEEAMVYYTRAVDEYWSGE